MAKSVGLSHQDMYHPNVSEHIDNHLNGDGTSTLGSEPSLVQASHPQAPQRPQAPQGGDATGTSNRVRHGGTSLGTDAIGAAVNSGVNSVARAVVPGYAGAQDASASMDSMNKSMDKHGDD